MHISKIFYFVLILHLILGKVTKFVVKKLSTSEVISQISPRGGGGEGGGRTSFTAFWVKKQFNKLETKLTGKNMLS